MTWLSTVAGALLVLVGLRDIFSTLWHPRGLGTICRGVFIVVWKALAPLNRRGHSTELAGPLGMLVTAVVWATMITVGWALLYLPHMPEGFYFGSSLSPAESSHFLKSLYLSMVAVATLGFGDIIPAAPALRLLVPLQALVGFILLTAAITWILEIYPALTRRRAQARRLRMLAATDAVGVVRSGEPSVASSLLHTVTEGLTTVEMDLTQYGETYYFRESSSDLALAATLPYALDMVTAGKESQAPEVRHAAAVLERATRSLVETLDKGYIKCGGTTSEVLEAYATDHQHQIITR